MSKKLKIMETAIELFSKNGVESTSIQDITNACGISKGAFYLSFKSKDDLLVEITDHFMEKFISKYHLLLDNTIPTKKKLTKYYYYNFKLLEEHYPFINACMRENYRPMNKQVIEKIKEFQTLQYKTLLSIIHEIYGKKSETLKYDLVLIIRGFVGSFAEYIASHPQKYDLACLAESLAEKTDIIVEYSKIHFLNEILWNFEQVHLQKSQFSKENILIELNKYDNDQFSHLPIIHETLCLLKHELAKEHPSIAILTGLASNLQKLDEFSWLTFLIKQYVASLEKVSNSK